MQPISATSHGPRAGTKAAPCRTCGKTGQQPVRRRQQQRGGAQFTLNPQTGKVEIRYVQR